MTRIERAVRVRLTASSVPAVPGRKVPVPGHEKKLPPSMLLGVVLAASLAMNPGAGGQPSPVPTVDVQRLGPQVGDAVPAFSLPDHAGKVWTLTDVLGAKGALLVFARSADW